MSINKRLAQKYSLSEQDSLIYTQAIQRILKLLIHMGIVIKVNGVFTVKYHRKGVNLRRVGSNKRYIRAVLKKQSKFYIYSGFSQRSIFSKPKTKDVCKQ